MRSLSRITAAALLSVTAVAAAQSPAFEAATVKKRMEPGGGSMGRRPGGRFIAQGVSLQDLIVFAYNIQPHQITGGPEWLDRDRWDVNAGGATGTQGDVLIALQRLITERFSLVVRREMRELPVYALVLARPDGRLGPQMKRSAVDCAAMQAEALKTGVVPPNVSSVCAVQGTVGRVQLAGSSLAQMTPLLSTRLQRTVIDRTGLTGAWDLMLTYTPEPSQISPGALSPGATLAVDPNGPSIFTAVQEQLGLRLESTRAPVNVLVIERAEPAKE